MKLIRLIASPILIVRISGSLCVGTGNRHFCGKFVRSGPLPANYFYLCSMVYFIATLAGCQSVGHVSSGRLFQKNQ